MTMKFYQINGVWNTYQYWHDNYGYTIEPTQSMNFKSSSSGTWGTSVNPGYFTSPGGYTIDNWSFWSEGIVGWKDLDELALAGAYPATAIDILLERNGTVANAVYVDDSDELYYLIDGYLSDGWRPWNEVEADGWQVYEGNQPYYMVINETTGEIVYSISETEENPSMVFSQVGHIEMPDSDMITVYETGVPVESFYFTTNGRNETQNTYISHADIPVYLEDGTAPAADTPYDGASVLAFMDVDGNTKQANGESLYLDDGVLMLDAPDTDEGEQWAALVEYIPEVVLKVKWGDTVNVPSGYKVSEVRTFVGYAFHSYFASPAQNEKAIAWPKKNVYFDDIEGHTLLQSATGTLGSETWPLVEVFQCTSLHGASGMYLTVGYRNSTAAWNTQERLTNGTNLTTGDYSVYLRGEDTTALNNAVNSGYPVRFLWFIWDSTQGQWYEAVWWKTPEAFRVPNDLWSFSNGTFSWLGNSEDTSSLAWYYKHDWDGFEMEGFDGVWFYVHCIHDPTPEPPAPSLPTVEITNGLAAVGSSADYCYSRSFVPIYDSSQNRILYDSTKSYVVQIGNGSGTIWGIEFFCASDSSGYLVAWNRTNVTLLVLGASIYSCSSNSAYRVIVSDSSNVKYPAFAYDLSGTTYYYVCDGVQTDWTDDLSTIGYSLVTGSEAYLTSLGSSETTDTLISNSSFYLYSSSGASLYGNQSKKYVLIGQFLKDGTNVTNDGMDSRLTTGMNCSAVNVSSSTSSWNKLMLAGTIYSYNAFRITYLEV